MIARPHPVTILVVDNQSWVRHLIRRMLTSVGYAVLEAPTAEQAMIVAERHISEIDLLLTEVMLPDMNGVDLAYCLGGIMPLLRITVAWAVDPAASSAQVRSKVASLKWLTLKWGCMVLSFWCSEFRVVINTGVRSRLMPLHSSSSVTRRI